MLKTCAIVFGIIMVIVGILGFIPQVTPHGLLLDLFHVNVEHNWIHILTGVISILCGLSSEHASRLFFQIFGIVYLLVAILGIFYGDRPIFGLIANNRQMSFCISLLPSLRCIWVLAVVASLLRESTSKIQISFHLAIVDPSFLFRAICFEWLFLDCLIIFVIILNDINDRNDSRDIRKNNKREKNVPLMLFFLMSLLSFL